MKLFVLIVFFLSLSPTVFGEDNSCRWIRGLDSSVSNEKAEECVLKCGPVKGEMEELAPQAEIIDDANACGEWERGGEWN